MECIDYSMPWSMAPSASRSRRLFDLVTLDHILEVHTLEIALDV